MASKRAQKSLHSWFTEHIQEKRSFWKENKATSHHHFPAINPQAKCGIDWQGFQFQTPQSCQHRASTASCLPHGLLVSTATFLLLTTNITLLFWRPFVAQTAARMGLKGLIPSKSDTGAVVSEDPVSSQFSATTQERPSNRHKTSPVPHLVLTTSLWITQTHRTGPLLTTVTTEPRSQTCVNWARHSARLQDTRAPDLFHHRHCWH